MGKLWAEDSAGLERKCASDSLEKALRNKYEWWAVPLVSCLFLAETNLPNKYDRRSIPCHIIQTAQTIPVSQGKAVNRSSPLPGEMIGC